MENDKPKAKKRIKKFDFSGSDSAVALVGPAVGGSANSYSTLVIKNTSGFSQESLEKASKVKVEIPIEEFLRRFFDLYYEDAEILARTLGYTTEMQENEEAYKEYESQAVASYDDYITSKVQSFQVMKSLKEGNFAEVISGLQEAEYIQLLQDQEYLEKAFKEVESKKELSKADASEGTPQFASEVKGEAVASVVKQENRSSNMSSTEQVKDEAIATEEVIAKSQFVELEKAFNEQKESLAKALEEVAKFQAEKKEAVAKSRMDALKTACGTNAEVMFKAVGEADQAIFDSVVAALGAMQAKIEKSALYEEVGASIEAEEVQEESSVAKLIKSKYSK